MHSPETVAFEIRIGKKYKKDGNYRSPIITIWHVDPEKDGTDDSCGWFMRARHGSKVMKEKIRRAIALNFDNEFTSESGAIYHMGLFTKSGNPTMSTMAITLQMFKYAAWAFFEGNDKKHTKWMKENLYDIIQFAENPVDSLRTDIEGVFRISTGAKWNREEQIENYTNIIYGWLLRSNRKWYQHPRWHIHHWKIQFHPWQNLKRRYWDKCCVCKKRGFKTPSMTDWNGTQRWHQECGNPNKTQVKDEQGQR